jgi:hypothetical protein
LLASEDARLPALAARDDDNTAKSYSPQRPSLNTERQGFVKVRAAAFPVNLRLPSAQNAKPMKLACKMTAAALLLCAAPAQSGSTPTLAAYAEVPVVQTRMNNALNALCIIDTGSYTAQFGEDLAERTGDTVLPLGSMQGVLGRDVVANQQIERIAIADYAREKLHVATNEASAVGCRLGMEFLGQSRVAFDPRGGQLLLNAPALVKPKKIGVATLMLQVGMPTIKGKVGGEPARFLLATGQEKSACSAYVYGTQKSLQLTWFKGLVLAPTVNLQPAAYFGAIGLRDQKVCVIGWDLLRHYAVDFDLPKKKLFVFEP